MSENKNTADHAAPETNEGNVQTPETTKAERRVDVFIPRTTDGTGDPNLQVTVNGETFLLPRGKSSKVPKYVYDEIQRSYRAQERLDDLIAAQKAKSNFA